MTRKILLYMKKRCLYECLAQLFLEWEIFEANVLDKIRRSVLFSILFFHRKIMPFIRNNVERYCRGGQAADDNIIWLMRFACLITEATYSHSEYVILIVSLRQQWLRERGSLFRYTYFTCLVHSAYYSSL